MSGIALAGLHTLCTWLQQLCAVASSRQCVAVQDVHDVTPDEAAAPALKKARRVVETPDGKEQGVVELHACQEGENDYAEVVVVYEPEGTSLMMGGLHPRVCTRT